MVYSPPSPAARLKMQCAAFRSLRRRRSATPPFSPCPRTLWTPFLCVLCFTTPLTMRIYHSQSTHSSPSPHTGPLWCQPFCWQLVCAGETRSRRCDRGAAAKTLARTRQRSTSVLRPNRWSAAATSMASVQALACLCTCLLSTKSWRMPRNITGLKATSRRCEATPVVGPWSMSGSNRAAQVLLLRVWLTPPSSRLGGDFQGRRRRYNRHFLQSGSTLSAVCRLLFLSSLFRPLIYLCSLQAQEREANGCEIEAIKSGSPARYGRPGRGLHLRQGFPQTSQSSAASCVPASRLLFSQATSSPPSTAYPS